MDNFHREFAQFLVNTIQSAKLAAGGREVVCRCPFCMDSRDPRSAHFYIGVDPDSDKPIMYNCKKCNESGIFTYKTLRLFDIYDSNIDIDLENYNKKIMSKPGTRVYKNTGVHFIRNTMIQDCDISRRKLAYINDRLGLQLSYQDMIDNKIVLNLYDLLNQNNITQLTRDKRVVDGINYNFIGFMSYDNGFLNSRCIVDPDSLNKPLNKRYVNYNIFNSIDNSRRYYILPNKIDILDPRPIQIHAAEGPFDILGIYYNVMNGDKDRKIYGSIGGKSYISIIKFFTQELGLLNIEPHIYVDKDIDDWEINKIQYYLSGLNLNVYIHRNGYPGEKDFGVPRDRIQDNIFQINKKI